MMSDEQTEQRRRRRSHSHSKQKKRPSISIPTGLLVRAGIGFVVLIGLAAWIILHAARDDARTALFIDPIWRMDGISRPIEAVGAALRLDNPKAEKPAPADLAAARQQLTDAVETSPLNTYALFLLSQEARLQGDSERADAIDGVIAASTKRNPPYLLGAVREAIDAKDDAGLLAAADPYLRATIPVDAQELTGPAADVLTLLVGLSNDAAVQPLIVQRLEVLPPWWRAYLWQLAKSGPPQAFVPIANALSEAVARMSAGKQVPRGFSEDSVRKAIELSWWYFLNRLIDSGSVATARQLWAARLTDQQRLGLGYLYNGSFAFGSSDSPFDWRLPRVNGADLAILPTGGPAGLPALSIAFSGAQMPYGLRLTTQTLTLDPGDYLLTGKVKPNGLQTPRGVAWRIYCVEKAEQSVLAETPYFRGASDWTDFEVRFTVPPNKCDREIIAVGMFPRILNEQKIVGRISFADLDISQDLGAAPDDDSR